MSTSFQGNILVPLVFNFWDTAANSIEHAIIKLWHSDLLTRWENKHIYTFKANGHQTTSETRKIPDIIPSHTDQFNNFLEWNPNWIYIKPVLISNQGSRGDLPIWTYNHWHSDLLTWWHLKQMPTRFHGNILVPLGFNSLVILQPIQLNIQSSNSDILTYWQDWEKI